VRNATRRDNREGVIGVWMVVALLALVGMAALVFDLGRLTLAAQHVQSVADSAALAGALQLPDYAVCEQRLQAIVDSNNGDRPVWPVVVDPMTDLVYYTEGTEVPGYGTLEDDEYAVAVTAHSTVTYSFARLFGINEVEVTRTATALSTGSGSPGSGIFFAGETDPSDYGIVITGSDHYMDGTIHSNTKVRFTGSHQVVEGDVEYLHDFRMVGSGHEIRGDSVESTVQPYPVDFQWSDYDQGPWDYVISGDLRQSGGSLPSGRYRIHGALRITGSDFSCSDSLFVVDDEIRFAGSGHQLDHVTLVAGDEIVFTAAMKRYSPFVDNLFAFAHKSGNSALRISGAWSDTWGILYAPNGELNYDGSHHELHYGALIANTIEINGSDGQFCGLGDDGDGGERSVRLIN